MECESPIVVVYRTKVPECYREGKCINCRSILTLANVPMDVLRNDTFDSLMLYVIIGLALFGAAFVVCLLQDNGFLNFIIKSKKKLKNAEAERKNAGAERDEARRLLMRKEEEVQRLETLNQKAQSAAASAKRKEEAARREAKVAQQRAEEETQRSNQLLEMRIAQDQNFQNLNDPTRLEKLVQMYKDLENNERLDVMDVLEASGMTKRTYMEFPARVVMETYKLAADHLNKCQEEILVSINTAGKSALDGLQECMVLEVKRELRQRAARSSVDPLITAFADEAVQTLAAHQDNGVQKFITSCARLTWLMVLQATPVVPVLSTPGASMKENVFRRHVESKAGRPLNVTIWPALVRGASTSSEEAMALGCVMDDDEEE